MLIYQQAITVVRAATVVDEYGNEAPDWANAVRAAAGPVSVQPSSQAEPPDAQRDKTVTQWRVISGPGVDIDIAATDRVELPDGTVCGVVGRPARWSSADGRLDHVEVVVEEVAG